MTRYLFNQLLFVLAVGVFLASFFVLLTIGAQHPLLVVVFFGVNAICIHYLLNLVHLGSHYLISRNRLINSFFGNVAAILGGVTFADFRATHALHHRSPSDPSKDPDHYITNSGNMFSIPFKIFYHDVYFWKNGLWKKGNWKGYIIDRCVQICLVFILSVTGTLWIWINFWLVPVFLVGLLNGMFLFYFPHYTTRLERNWRAKSSPHLFAQFSLLAIDISRYYHEKHHDRVSENKNYFPVYSFLVDLTQKLWATNIRSYSPRYTENYPTMSV